MPHSLTFAADNYGDGTQILFRCSKCAKEIAFAREGDGEPHVTNAGGIWVLPENPEQWLDPCED